MSTETIIVGMHWPGSRKSAVLLGVDDDAEQIIVDMVK